MAQVVRVASRLWPLSLVVLLLAFPLGALLYPDGWEAVRSTASGWAHRGVFAVRELVGSPPDDAGAPAGAPAGADPSVETSTDLALRSAAGEAVADDGTVTKSEDERDSSDPPDRQAEAEADTTSYPPDGLDPVSDHALEMGLGSAWLSFRAPRRELTEEEERQIREAYREALMRLREARLGG